MASDDLDAELGLLEAMYADDAAAALRIQRDAATVSVRLSLPLPAPSTLVLTLMLTVANAYPSDGSCVKCLFEGAARVDDVALARVTQQLASLARELATGREPALLPLIEHAKGQLDELTTGSSQCPICLQAASADSHNLSACGHTFHAACLFTWLVYCTQQHEQSNAVTERRMHARAIVAAARSDVHACETSIRTIETRLHDIDAEAEACRVTVQTYVKQLSTPSAAKSSATSGKQRKGAGQRAAAAAAADDAVTVEQHDVCVARLTAIQALRPSLLREQTQYGAKLESARQELGRVTAAQHDNESAAIAVLARTANLDCPSCRAPLPPASLTAFIAYAEAIVPRAAAGTVVTPDAVVAALQSSELLPTAHAELEPSALEYVRVTRRKHAALHAALSAGAKGAVAAPDAS